LIAKIVTNGVQGVSLQGIDLRGANLEDAVLLTKKDFELY
jgi:uncharacterized protein YjbI with pentapeptide repeats